MSHTKALQTVLFNELKDRIKEDDQSVPTLNNGYYYYNREAKGKQYSVYCRRKEALDAPEEVILDGNKLAEGNPTFMLWGYQVSNDNNTLA